MLHSLRTALCFTQQGQTSLDKNRNITQKWRPHDEKEDLEENDGFFQYEHDYLLLPPSLPSITFLNHSVYSPQRDALLYWIEAYLFQKIKINRVVSLTATPVEKKRRSDRLRINSDGGQEETKQDDDDDDEDNEMHWWSQFEMILQQQPYIYTAYAFQAVRYFLKHHQHPRTHIESHRSLLHTRGEKDSPFSVYSMDTHLYESREDLGSCASIRNVYKRLATLHMFHSFSHFLGAPKQLECPSIASVADNEERTNFLGKDERFPTRHIRPIRNIHRNIDQIQTELSHFYECFSRLYEIFVSQDEELESLQKLSKKIVPSTTGHKWESYEFPWEQWKHVQQLLTLGESLLYQLQACVSSTKILSYCEHFHIGVETDKGGEKNREQSNQHSGKTPAQGSSSSDIHEICIYDESLMQLRSIAESLQRLSCMQQHIEIQTDVHVSDLLQYPSHVLRETPSRCRLYSDSTFQSSSTSGEEGEKTVSPSLLQQFLSNTGTSSFRMSHIYSILLEQARGKALGEASPFGSTSSFSHHFYTTTYTNQEKKHVLYLLPHWSFTDFFYRQRRFLWSINDFMQNLCSEAQKLFSCKS